MSFNVLLHGHPTSHVSTEFGEKNTNMIFQFNKDYNVDLLLKYIIFCTFGIKKYLKLTW